jgi:hypothetical protein
LFQRDIFGRAWGAKGEAVTKRLRDRPFVDREAAHVTWRLNLQLAQSTQSKMVIPNAQFDISVNGKDGPEHIQMEFDRKELAQFYTQLEIVQEQLDHLT